MGGAGGMEETTGGCGISFGGCGISFWGVENVLPVIVVMTVQLSIYQNPLKYTFYFFIAIFKNLFFGMPLACGSSQARD